MALRVLLADESSTIKKVFQLALQDFAVDVRPVNVGIDVVMVAENFKPDIIFADVLLQKKSGYEVSADIKQNPTLSSIPVVLMWSGFLELDEDKFQASHANAQLEKPFDVAALRKLVTDLVPRTQNQRLSQFLTFPKLPEIEDKSAPPPLPASDDLPPPMKAQMDVEEEFEQVSIPKMRGAQAEKYRMNLNPEELEADHVPVEYQTSDEAIDVDAVFATADATDEEDEPFTVRPPAASSAMPAKSAMPANSTKPATPTKPAPAPTTAVSAPTPVASPTSVASPKPAVAAPPEPVAEVREFTDPDFDFASPKIPSLSAEQLEKIIREQSAEVIESVVWKVVPDLAAQIIERELNRLLKERESQPY